MSESPFVNDLWFFNGQVSSNVTSVLQAILPKYSPYSMDDESAEKNFTSDVGEISDNSVYNLIITIAISAVLGVLILGTIVGNLFVIIAILSERNLRTVGNYLLLSLAIADLMVACLVMPLGAVYAVSAEWQMGEIACDIWTSTDVLCCTASILHLLAIAIDRYWAVTSIDYIRNRNSNRIGLLIFIIWTVSALISVAPILGLKDEGFKKRIEEEKRCFYSQDVTYQVIATVSTFYGPLIFILILYWRIYQVAKKRIRHKPGKNIMLKVSAQQATVTLDTTTTSDQRTQLSESPDCVTVNSSLKETSFKDRVEKNSNSIRNEEKCSSSNSSRKNVNSKSTVNANNSRESIEAKRERKAVKTLTIITGAFVSCWFPFFVVALLMPICGEICNPGEIVLTVILWLGWVNSLLNPIIYTIFSPDFRAAFNRILLGRKPNYNRPCNV